MADIDYTQKILTFNLLVGNNDQEIAYNYLKRTNWDENKAAILYNQENTGSQASMDYPIDDYYSMTNNNIMNKQSYSSGYSGYSYSKKHKVNLAKLNKYRECAIYNQGFFDIFKIFKVDNRGYYIYFERGCPKCPGLTKFYDSFITQLKSNVGLILLYSPKTLNDAINLLIQINNDEMTKDLIKTKTIIHPLINSCLEGGKIEKQLKIKSKDYPVIIVCFDKNDTHFAVIDIIKNANKNIQRLNEKILEGHDLFCDEKDSKINNISPIISQPKTDSNIISNEINNNIISDNKGQNLMNDINNYLPEDINNKSKGDRDSYTYMTDGEVLARQEKEIKALEKEEENKILEAERKEKEQKEEEERKKQEEILEKAKMESIICNLPEEPNDDYPDKCVILFRFPDGEKVVERKFLKTEKVSLLYLYVSSFGNQIYNEKEQKGFSLIQTFPFKNFDEVQENTLEQEGLFPNAMLQIRISE